MSITDCKDCPEGVYCGEEATAYAPIYINLDAMLNVINSDVCSIANPEYPGSGTWSRLTCDDLYDDIANGVGGKVYPCPLGFYCPIGTEGEYIDGT